MSDSLPTHSQQYWRKNLQLIGGCLVVWFSVSFLAGIVFVEFFNQFSLGGYKLGFWFAQQGSIFVFVLLIVFYNWRIKKLDQAFLTASKSA